MFIESVAELHKCIDSSIATCVLFLDASPFSASLQQLVSELQSEFSGVKFAWTSTAAVISEAKVSVLPEALFFVRGSQWSRRYGEAQAGLVSVPWLIERLEELEQTQMQTIQQRCKELVNQHSIMLFMKGSPANPVCGFSRQLVALLAQAGVQDYGHFDILADEEIRQHLKVISNWPTYPQLYAHGQLVGGLDIAKELFAEGLLRKELHLD